MSSDSKLCLCISTSNSRAGKASVSVPLFFLAALPSLAISFFAPAWLQLPPGVRTQDHTPYALPPPQFPVFLAFLGRMNPPPTSLPAGEVLLLPTLTAHWLF